MQAMITGFAKPHILCLASLILVLPQLAWPQPVDRTEVRIGFNYPQSGPYAPDGLSQYRGARLAADEINAQGGILGREIRLITRDSASHVRKTRGNVKSLIEDEKVEMVFGGVSSDVAISACELCQRSWIPFFGTLTYSTATTGEAAHRACFRESYNAWMASKLLARYLNKHDTGGRYFFLTADYNWGWTAEQSLREMTGTTDRGRHPGVRTPLGSSSYIEALRQAEAAAPETLVLILGGMELATALRQATVMGLKKQCRIVVPNMMRTGIVGAGPKAMEGVIGVIPWFDQVPSIFGYPRGVRFVQRFKASYDDYPTSAAASAYTILYEYKAAVERAGSFEGPAVIRALEGQSYQIVKDKQTWRAFDHQSLQTIYLVKGRPATEYIGQPAASAHIEILDSMPGHMTVRTKEEWEAVRRRAGKPITLEQLAGE